MKNFEKVTVKFTFDQGKLADNILLFAERFNKAMDVFCAQGALKLSNYAKGHRPWTDRTNAARERLNAGFERTKTGWVIYLAHGVTYGVFLEYAMEERFAILMPTIHYVGKLEIMPAFENFLEKISRRLEV